MYTIGVLCIKSARHTLVFTVHMNPIGIPLLYIAVYSYKTQSCITVLVLYCVKQSKTYTPGVYFNFSYTLILPLAYNINIHGKCITNYNSSITTTVYRSILTFLHGDCCKDWYCRQCNCLPCWDSYSHLLPVLWKTH